VKTNLLEHPLELPFQGTLETSAIGLSRDRIELPPRINVRQGYRIAPILVTVRHGACTRCEVLEVKPEFLHAKVTRQSETTWRLEVQLPAGESDVRNWISADAWRHLQAFGFEEGQITLSLDHAEVKQLVIPITGSHFQFE
jgi:hypothetical protein